MRGTLLESKLRGFPPREPVSRSLPSIHTSLLRLASGLTHGPCSFRILLMVGEQDLWGFVVHSDFHCRFREFYYWHPSNPVAAWQLYGHSTKTRQEIGSSGMGLLSASLGSVLGCWWMIEERVRIMLFCRLYVLTRNLCFSALFHHR
jgi:hypothetical protein